MRGQMAHQSWKKRASEKIRKTQCVSSKKIQIKSQTLPWWRWKLEVEPTQIADKDCHSDQ